MVGPLGHVGLVGDARREDNDGKYGLCEQRQPLCILWDLCYVRNWSAAPNTSRPLAHKGWVMDFTFFFFGLLSTIAGLVVIKKTSKNEH
ncbi:hypothetical protein [Humidesulfovibrio mexicanus]|uniref:hypothetical protein n=1 Tax=Humidesulfovibrio mexicanus TaxID=147047 RepID=UPI00117854EB|nr:hypothetical protein [Humidesulfovibrio mexicanus]